MNQPRKTFEEMYEEIDAFIESRRSKWRLKAISWMDYADVAQVIRIHIFKKWHLWDQDRPIGPWVNRIVSNQIKNMIRNTYSSSSRPCFGCEYNTSPAAKLVENGTCSFTKNGSQCNDCGLFAKWEKTKKAMHNVKVPVSLEGHKNTYLSAQAPIEYNFERANKNLHNLMKEELSDRHYFIYKMMFIDKLPDSEIAKVLNFKTSEVGRQAGYKQIKNIKNNLYKRAQHILQRNDVFNEF